MKKLRIIIAIALIALSIETHAQADSCKQETDTAGVFQTTIKKIRDLGTGIKHKVSYYADKFNGRLTASGKIFSNYGYTCAAISCYKFGDLLLVTNIYTGRSVKVVVTDRGNFARFGRTLDLSKRAFAEIANPYHGLCTVTIEKIN
jgi:rare lipoprotein A